MRDDESDDEKNDDDDDGNDDDRLQGGSLASPLLCPSRSTEPNSLEKFCSRSASRVREARGQGVVLPQSHAEGGVTKVGVSKCEQMQR